MEDSIFPASYLTSVVTAQVAYPSLVVRPLTLADYENGYVALLGQLTNVGDVTKEQFEDQFRKMKEAGTYYIIVIEDSQTGKVCASTTLFLEFKFIHSCSLRARIEDVVVDCGYRGKGLGKSIVETAIKLSRKLGCYKISLDCRDQMLDFYRKIGFVSEEGRANMVVIRF